MSKPTYVYILFDPTYKSKRFYVGYSYDPQHRLSGHLTIKGENRFKDRWIAKMKNRGVIPIPFSISLFPNEDLAGQAEKELITFCRKIGIKLVNILEGGNKPPILNGEKVIIAKLTWLKVAEIRNKYFNDMVSPGRLAKKYSVSKVCIKNVIRYKTWIEKIEIPLDLEQLLEVRQQYGRNTIKKLNSKMIADMRYKFLYENVSRFELYKLYPQISKDQIVKIVAYRIYNDNLDEDTKKLVGRRIKEEKDLIYSKKSKSSNSGRSNLDDNDVLLIKQLYLTREYKQKELAIQFNVSNQTINRIVLNKIMMRV